MVNKSPLWWEWICHSNFSFLTGGSHPEDYVQRAHAFGYRGLGMTDYDGVYGLVRAYRQHCELPDKDHFKLFYGCELHLAEDHARPVVYRDSVILLALNLRGYQQLNQLISYAHRDSKATATMPLEQLLAAASSDLICLQPMRGLIRREKIPAVMQRYQQLREAFGSNFFLIISRHLNPLEDRWIPLTLELGRRLDIPYLCSQDSFFHDAKSKEISDIMQAIRLNQSIDDIIPHLFINHERCLHKTELLHQRYQSLPGFAASLQRSAELAERFSFSLRDLRYQYPQEMLPPGHSAQSYLEDIVWPSAQMMYPQGVPSSIQDILRKELQLSAQLEIADYFLTVWEIVRWARAQGILCQGRGSAANSAICFVLGITSVNPDRFDVLFERFISTERGDRPDIDVDFEHERREEVIQFIYQRYGRHRASMVANVIRFRHRSALRMVGKALGIPLSVIESVGSSQELRFERWEASSSKSVIPAQNQTKEAFGEPSEIPWELWFELVSRIKNFPRHMGIHSGGFVLNHQDMNAVCPQEPATMLGRSIIQWSKEDIEYLNIFKIDVLALGMLTVIRKAFGLIQESTGLTLTLANIKEDDPATYQMIQRAETVGTFQIESRAQMSMLPRLRPSKFYELVVQVGIIRPGPIQGGLIHSYMRRRQGKEPITYPDPRLVPILKRTLGIPIFQEQVMRMAMTVGYFTGGEADELRKHIGSWSSQGDFGPLVKKLELGMRKNGVEERFIAQILDQLKGFASYGFPESHAVSFALLAYASSYLKCHHPEAFYTALLNSQPVGFYSIHALVQNARREGIEFRPIDINRSNWNSHMEPKASSGSWAIRLGLHLVGGLSKTGADRLLERRHQQGLWSELQQFFQSSISHRGDLAALAAAGALHGFGIPRAQAIWMAEAVPFAPLLDQEYAYAFDKEDDMQRMERDFASFATSLGQHPAQLLKDQYWSYELPKAKLDRASELSQRSDRATVHVFGLVLVRQAPMTAKGMEFYTLEDETGFINLVFNPQTLALYKKIAHQQAFLCITGRLQRQQEGHAILVQRVHERKPKDPKLLALRERASSTSHPGQQEIFHKLPPARNFH